jgi:hypothetical protein
MHINMFIHIYTYIHLCREVEYIDTQLAKRAGVLDGFLSDLNGQSYILSVSTHIYMYFYLYLYICIYIYIYRYCIYVHIYLCMYVCTRTYPYISMHIHILLDLNGQSYILSVCINLYSYTNICRYVFICI